MTMKLLATCVLLSSLGGLAERPGIQFQTGETLVVELHTQTENRLKSMRLFQGETVAGQMETDSAKPSREERTLRFTDRFVQADGAPFVVRRSFAELLQVLGTEKAREVKGELEGRTIVLTADGDGSATAELEGEPDVDAAFLTGHRMPYAVLGLLPATDVAPGDTWELEEPVAFELLGLVDGAKLFAGASAEKDRFEKLLTRIAHCKGSARLDRTEERDGEKCWVLAYELSVEATSDEFELGMVGIPHPPGISKGTMKLESSGKGTLWIARDRRAPVARDLALGGTMSVGFAKGDRRTEIELSMTHEETQHWRP